ncbi:hypothetical protein [Thermococcus sibiricus]|uniref:Uncharacterized protein n=1 Tax=Thermococcus sibiricus TaxID=172049 RepID=A0A117L1B9_9EURY|nr:hypothetical protein [Thermococcus sibiricus]KUK17726.1 MAG: Uncharacterized protein XD54_1008 [Thermococcus sibiricus]
MLDILGFIFYAGASLVILFIAAFSGGISRLIAVPAALGYILLAFWSIEQASSDIIRKDQKRDESLILLLNIASFGLGAISFYLYMNSVVTPTLLLGPAFVIGLWRSWKG